MWPVVFVAPLAVPVVLSKYVDYVDNKKLSDDFKAKQQKAKLQQQSRVSAFATAPNALCGGLANRTTTSAVPHVDKLNESNPGTGKMLNKAMNIMDKKPEYYRFQSTTKSISFLVDRPGL